MAEAHHRKKDPAAVRQGLIDSAIALAEADGIAGVTMQSVARMAGVSKGGLCHHFENKEALIEGMMAHLLDCLDRDIDARMTADPQAFGRFSRAYARAILGDESARLWKALVSVLFTSPAVQQMWQDWMRERLSRHHETDSHPSLSVLRMATDGAWLYMLSDGAYEMTMAEMETLIAGLTKKDSPLFRPA